MRKMKPLASCAALLLLSGLLPGCQVMSSTVDTAHLKDGSQQRRCTSGLGSYALAYSTVRFTVKQRYEMNTNVPFGRPYMDIDAPEAHPDPRHIYCLNFLESPLSDDVVQVAYSIDQGNNAAGFGLPTGAATGLLSAVVSKNVDQSGEIIRNFIRAIFILISGNATGNFGRESIDRTKYVIREMTVQDVDPFDLAQMANLNRSLKEYGFCVTMGAYTHDARRMSADAYCNRPARVFAPGQAPAYAEIAGNQDYVVKKLPVGIYYRPRQPYELFVYVRDDAEIAKPWQLRKIDTILLENISPVISIGITRAAFAEKRVAFAFDHGNLLKVCVAKGSEVEGAIQIPLDIIYGIASLPSETIAAEIALKNGEVELLNAQEQLIDVQNAFIAFKSGTTKDINEQTGVPLDKSKLDSQLPPARTAPKAIGKVTDGNIDTLCTIIKGNGVGG